MKNGKLQVGIIGCGGIAGQKHLPALSSFPDLCKIVAFCDIIEERAVAACEKYGTPEARYYTDYKELLQDKDIDVVHVLTPNVAHAQITVDAFEAGKHVMCEKPMSHSASEAKRMIEAWKKSGKQFTIGYQNRFRPEVQALYKSCKAQELGEIYYGKAHAIRRRAVPTWGVFPDKSQQGGGPLIDIGTHALDLTLWMMDNYEPESVTGNVFYKLGTLPSAVDGNMFGPWDPETYEVEDSAVGLVKMKNGASVYIEASWAINMLDSREASTTLCGTLGGAEIRSGMSYAKDELIYNNTRGGVLTEEHMSAGGNIAYFEGESGEPGVLECKQWLRALLGEGEPLVKPEQAFVVTQILEGIYESARTGKEVRF